MIKIVCIGDNVVDINYIDGLINPGGNTVNVSVYSSQLGHRSAYIGVLGDDSYADIVKKSLDINGVDWHMSPILHGETGRCAVRLVDGERMLSEENGGGLVTSDPLVITEEMLEYIKGFDIVHTSHWSYVDSQMPKIKAAGIPIVYDYALAWNDEGVKSVAEFADYILFSRREALSKEENLKTLRDSVDKYHVKMSVMTMGTDGAYVYDGEGMYFKEPYNAEGGAIDTTGCGDSWISGFMTTYTEIMKRMEKMINSSDDKYILPENMADVKRLAIETGMGMGNLKARATCRIKGAYGCGVSIEDFERKEKQRPQ